MVRIQKNVFNSTHLRAVIPVLPMAAGGRSEEHAFHIRLIMNASKVNNRDGRCAATCRVESRPAFYTHAFFSGRSPGTFLHSKALSQLR